MIKNIILDIGGVMVYPRLGEWNIPYGSMMILGERARDIATAKYLIAHRRAAHWLDESQRMESLEDERAARRAYIRDMDRQMGWRLTEEEIRRLGDDFTENINRYGFFNDVLPWLKRWRGRYGLAALSDCMPSTPMFLEQWGVAPLLDAAVYSFQLGVIKPDPLMFHAALSALGAEPETCLYVDDRAENVEAADALGLHAVQMARSEFLPDRYWGGPTVRTFEALNAQLEAMNQP